MIPPKFIYRCSDCGHEEPKWRVQINDIFFRVTATLRDLLTVILRYQTPWRDCGTPRYKENKRFLKVEAPQENA
jgi:hypothetical protein